ncbi:universal stress protein [Streptomyces sp. NPDC090442]|uniref:universal stress protein n=1 Tax=Streptomyces sp. NPDC090442 TaxID=3365962 RepID=UPI00381E42A6
MSQTVERVVVGVNGSASSVEALRQAAEEAQCHDAVLCPTYVWAPPGGEATDGRIPPPWEVCAYWEQEADDILAEACQKALSTAPYGLRVVPRVIRGPAGAALVACADHDRDLLVMSAGSHGALYRCFHGSVSWYCLKHAHCPVLVVRTGDENGL